MMCVALYEGVSGLDRYGVRRGENGIKKAVMTFFYCILLLPNEKQYLASLLELRYISLFGSIGSIRLQE